jgi:hypothetical protein
LLAAAGMGSVAVVAVQQCCLTKLQTSAMLGRFLNVPNGCLPLSKGHISFVHVRSKQRLICCCSVAGSLWHCFFLSWIDSKMGATGCVC